MTTEVLGALVVIFGVSFLVEALVEYVFGTPFDKIPKLAPYKWLLMYIAGAVGVLASWVYQFDLVSLLAKSVQVDFPITIFGIILTGVAVGRGSQFLHQFVSQFFPTKQNTSG